MTKKNKLHRINNRIEKVPLRFKTDDIIGNTVYLKEDTLNFHIAGELGDHPERHFLYFGNNLKIVQRIIGDPGQIFIDKTDENRMNYFSTVAFESHTSLKNVKIVTEAIGLKQQDIVSIFPMKKIKEKIEGRIIYDRYSDNS